MKLELDFDNKLITIKDQISINKLIEFVKDKDLGDWKVQSYIEYNSFPYTQPYSMPCIETPYKPQEFTYGTGNPNYSFTTNQN